MENETTNENLKRMIDEDIHEYLRHLDDTAFELLAWMNRKDHVFKIVLIQGEICIQGTRTDNVYKCIDKDNVNRPLGQIMDDFFSDKSVLNEGLSVILDDIAVLIRRQ